MKLLVSDIDWTKLDDRERWTLENVIPLVEQGYKLEEIAAQLDVDHGQMREDIENLGARLVALSGRVEIPAHSDEEYEALKAAIAVAGQIYPILVGSPSSGMPGETIDGSGRRRACAELGFEPIVREIDGTADELRSLALVLNLARRHVSSSARRGIIKTELLRDPQRSDRAIATLAGVSPTTVGTVRRELEHRGAVSKLDTRTGVDGIAQPAAKPPTPRPPANERGERTIRVVVASELFDDLVGDWHPCKAFRIFEQRPGLYELHIQSRDRVPATRQQLAEIDQAVNVAAAALELDLEQITAQLLASAGEVFGSPLQIQADLAADEAEWMLARLAELTT